MKTKEAAGVRNFGRLVGDTFQGSAAGALGSAAATGVALGFKSLYNAATKHRDFKAMLAQNPDIEVHQQQQPKQVNAFFSSLRSVNHDFSADPVIAGSYLRQMLESPMPGGIAAQAAQMRDNRPNALVESIAGGAREGSRFGLESFKNRANKSEQGKSRDFAREMASHSLEADLHKGSVSRSQAMGDHAMKGPLQNLNEQEEVRFDNLRQALDIQGGLGIHPKPKFGR